MEKSRVISLFGLKGGVGKSVIALNTAVELSLQGKKTLFLDFDLKAPQSISRFMGLRNKYCLYDFSSSLGDFKTKKRKLKNYLARHESGLDFLPAISNLRQTSRLTSESIKDFLRFAAGEYEYVVIDAGSNLTDQLLSVFDLSSLIMLMLTPDVVSIYQTEWMIDTLQSLGYPLNMMKVVINRAESEGGVSLAEVKLLLVPELIALLPSEGKKMGFALNQGIPIVMDSPKAGISLALKNLVKKLTSQDSLYIDKQDWDGLDLKRKKISRENHTVTDEFLENIGMSAGAKAISEEEDRLIKLKKKIHSRLLSEMNLKKAPIRGLMESSDAASNLKRKAAKALTNIVSEESKGFISSSEVRKKIIKEILDESLGFGPLEDFLKDSSITEIMVNNKDQIYIERGGKTELTTKKFTSNQQVRSVIERILAPLGRRIDESSPYVDARLPDGSRVNAIISPLSLTGPTLTIRKFSHSVLRSDDLVKKYDSMNEDMATFLKACVRSRRNILISGGTGSGKTTLLNIISEFIPEGERIITIEDSAELNLSNSHWIRLESKPPNIEGKGEVTIRELFRNSLRMRPDRIVVGEVRSQEVLDMLQAMNTGHDGSMSTVHANSTRDVIIRMDSMILMSGFELPIRAIREIISSALDLIVHTARLSDGSRKIIQITEVGNMREDTSIELNNIFEFKQKGVSAEGKVKGDFRATGYLPSFYQELLARGINIPKETFLSQKPD